MKTLLKKLNKIWLGAAIGLAFVLSLSIGCVMNNSIEQTEVSAETLSVTLKAGEDFNSAIKSAINGYDINSWEYNFNIHSIVFGNYDDSNNNSFTYKGNNVISGYSPITTYSISNDSVHCDFYCIYNSTTSKYDIYILADYGYTIYANEDCSYMFYQCSSLTNLDLSNFDTSNVISMSGMFWGCFDLTNLDLSNFDTSNVTDMSGMFYEYYSLTNLDLSSFDTSNVTNMSSMFGSCSSLTNLDLSNFDTSNVTYMSSMFGSCSSLTNLDLSNFNTSNVTDMSYMFGYCNNLTTIYVNPNKWSTANVTSSSDMFYGCSKIVGGKGTTYNSSYRDKTYARVDTPSTPGYFSKLSVTLKIGQDFNSAIKSAANGYYVSYWDYNYNIQSIVFGNYDNNNNNSFTYKGNNVISGYSPNTTYSISNDSVHCDLYRIYDSSTSKYDIYILADYGYTIYANEDCLDMFSNCPSLTNLDLSNFDTSNVTDMSCMFWNCYSLTSLALSSFDTSNVIYMYDMFGYCSSLTNLDLSNFDTSNVTSMSGMFKDCSSLTTIDLSIFDVSNVTNMSWMFWNCYSLTSLALSSFDTSNVTDMSYMFCSCSSLTNLDLSNFDTSKVTDMSGMFWNCYSLTSLALSSFDTSNATNMGHMFCSCSSLTNLDLSNFDTSKVTDMSYMFELCNNLTTIYVNPNKWSTANGLYSYVMFYGCSKLVGQNGTTYSENYINSTYARVDTSSTPGYLTSVVLTVPDTSNAVLEYSQTEQTYLPVNWAEIKNYCVITVNKATEVGSYTATITINDDLPYIWSNGTKTTTINYTITKANIAIPVSGTTNIEYNGSLQTYLPTNWSAIVSYCTITGNTASALGNHTATIALNDTNNYQWSDGTTAPKTIAYSISKINVENPISVINEFTYNGYSYIFKPTNWSAIKDYCTISGNKAKEEGVYTATIALKDSITYQWSDGTTSPKTFTYTIAREEVALPVYGIGDYTYNGNEQTITPRNWYAISKYCTITNNVQKDAGTYTAIISLNNKTSYKWADNTTDDIEHVYTIKKLTISAPIAGNVKDNTYLPSNWDKISDLCDISNNTNEKGGEYTAVVSLKDSTNYTWADGTTENKEFTYEIKGTSPLSIGGVNLGTIIGGSVGGVGLLGGLATVIAYVIKKKRNA